MLIEKKPEKNDIVTMKLVSGDELIAKLVDNSENVITVANPFSVVVSPQGLAMVPYILTAPEKFEMTVDKKNIMTVFKTRKEVMEYYIQQTSGILTASAVPDIVT